MTFELDGPFGDADRSHRRRRPCCPSEALRYLEETLGMMDVPDGEWFSVGRRGPFRITFKGDPMVRDCFLVESHDGSDDHAPTEYVLAARATVP